MRGDLEAELTAASSTGETEDSTMTVFPRDPPETVQFVVKFQALLSPLFDSIDARELPFRCPFLLLLVWHGSKGKSFRRSKFILSLKMR